SSRAIDPKVKSAYENIAAARSPVPEAIAIGMLDRSVEVLKVDTDVSTEFVLRSELDELKREHTLASAPEILVPAGSPGSFSGSAGRKYGFVRLLAKSREE